MRPDGRKHSAAAASSACREGRRSRAGGKPSRACSSAAGRNVAGTTDQYRCRCACVTDAKLRTALAGCAVLTLCAGTVPSPGAASRVTACCLRRCCPRERRSRGRPHRRRRTDHCHYPGCAKTRNERRDHGQPRRAVGRMIPPPGAKPRGGRSGKGRASTSTISQGERALRG